ncbi:MAG: hypothetical protein OEN20_02230 [Gammaproteobacteria bacterium]|nr:hypothetical protein [Gammaproteobacteria bacterium]
MENCVKMMTAYVGICTLAALVANPVRADVNTGLLEREVGFVGDEIGARVTGVDRTDGNATVLDLSLPPLDEAVDRIEVLDRDGNVVEQLRPAQIESDQEQNRVGVRLHLKRAPKMAFRLRLYDDTDEQNTQRE